MSDTRIADILDALYDVVVAQTDIAAAIAAKTLRAFDGPPAVDFSAGTMLVIGGAVNIDDEPQTEVTWEWGSLGVSGTFADVDEQIDIPCGISTKAGNSQAMRTLRRTAIGFYANAAAAIRGTTLSIPQVMWCTPAVSAIQQLQTQSGAECIVSFIARVRTRI